MVTTRVEFGAEKSFFDELGGKPCLEQVHRIFYNKLLAHPWLKGFFVDKAQDKLESQQTGFMMSLFGGPQVYGGRMPKSAHIHLFVTEEIFLLRHQLLGEALSAENVPDDLKARWLEYDMKMKPALVKRDISECEGRYRNEEVIAVEKP